MKKKICKAHIKRLKNKTLLTMARPDNKPNFMKIA